MCSFTIFFVLFSCYLRLTNPELTQITHIDMLSQIGYPVKIWVMGHAGPETMNECAGEDQQ
jgi:hypothetical protein